MQVVMHLIMAIFNHIMIKTLCDTWKEGQNICNIGILHNGIDKEHFCYFQET